MELVNLTILFKSGRSITIDSVRAWEVRDQGGELVGITIEQVSPKTRLVVKSLDLKSIDAIVETK